MKPNPLALVVLLLTLGGAAVARAELVVLTDGNVLKVKAFEAVGEQAWITLPVGGRMTVPIERVERVVDDEVVPEPPAPPVAEVVAEAPPPRRWGWRTFVGPGLLIAATVIAARSARLIEPQF